MSWMLPVEISILLVILTIASYVVRMYAEMGRFLSREFQENIEAFETRVEPRLGVAHDRAALAFAVLMQLSLAAIAVLTALATFREPQVTGRDIVELVVTLLLVVIVFVHLLPYLFFSRTRGEWIVPLTPLLRLLIWVTFPVTLILGFFLSIASLSKENSSPAPENQSEAVEALIEAGTEEGILEEGDRHLIQSVVEFGDKTVRDVMTARPDMFVVPSTMTVEQFTETLRQNAYSRVPVYEEALDNIVGIVFAHDVLQVPDTEASQRTVASLMRPEVMFVPESKRGSDLLREMQRENVHMAIVIDEYGGVAGVVTIEDLVEEIVGEIRDEHETEAEIIHEADGSYVVPGWTDVDLLDDLFSVRINGDYEATTVGGLISEIAGRIPPPGDVVESEGLRFEVLDSTERRVERVRISTAQPEGASA